MKSKIKAGDQLYIGLIYEEHDRIMAFHANVWLSSPIAKRTMVLLGDNNHIDPHTFEKRTMYGGDRRSVIAFTKQADYQAFVDWWAKYSERFNGNMAREELPMPKDNRINGYMVEHTSIKGVSAIEVPRASRFINQWQWIVNNTQGNVYWTLTHWVFEDEQDAVMFKLRSSGAEDGVEVEMEDESCMEDECDDWDNVNFFEQEAEMYKREKEQNMKKQAMERVKRMLWSKDKFDLL